MSDTFDIYDSTFPGSGLVMDTVDSEAEARKYAREYAKMHIKNGTRPFVGIWRNAPDNDHAGDLVWIYDQAKQRKAVVERRAHV